MLLTTVKQTASHQPRRARMLVANVDRLVSRRDAPGAQRCRRRAVAGRGRRWAAGHRAFDVAFARALIEAENAEALRRDRVRLEVHRVDALGHERAVRAVHDPFGGADVVDGELADRTSSTSTSSTSRSGKSEEDEEDEEDSRARRACGWMTGGHRELRACGEQCNPVERNRASCWCWWNWGCVVGLPEGCLVEGAG